MSQLGIYGANYKISIIITLFIQAFRYAAEPFFFAQQKDKNAKNIYAKVMNYFVAVVAFIFLGVMFNIEYIKYFIPNSAYWEGLKVVPTLLFANIFLGIYYNQSIWYKLTDKTMYGALIAVFGAFITLVMNFILIPRIGYVGSAYTTLACYFSMVLFSYFLGQKYFPITYDLKKIIGYLLGAFFIWQLWTFVKIDSQVLRELFKWSVLTFVLGILIFIIGFGTLIAGVVGISNIMVYIVKERTKELGIRKALGATPKSIVGMIMLESIFVTAIAGYSGLMIGVFTLRALGDTLEKYFILNPSVETYVVVGATIVLIIAGTIAGYIPAKRAARIKPIVALNDE